MRYLSDCFLKGSIVKNLLNTEKFLAIHELIQRAPVFSAIKNLNEFEEAVFEREKIQSTGVGRGVAIAHARITETDRILIALGVSREGIEYQAMDGKPVHFLFLIANHPERREEYLKVLSSIMRLVRDDSFRNFLLEKCKSDDTPDEIADTLRNAFFASLRKASGRVSVTG